MLWHSEYVFGTNKSDINSNRWRSMWFCILDVFESLLPETLLSVRQENFLFESLEMKSFFGVDGRNYLVFDIEVYSERLVLKNNSVTVTSENFRAGCFFFSFFDPENKILFLVWPECLLVLSRLSIHQCFQWLITFSESCICFIDHHANGWILERHNTQLQSSIFVFYRCMQTSFIYFYRISDHFISCWSGDRSMTPKREFQ